MGDREGPSWDGTSRPFSLHLPPKQRRKRRRMPGVLRLYCDLSKLMRWSEKAVSKDSGPVSGDQCHPAGPVAQGRSWKLTSSKRAPSPRQEGSPWRDQPQSGVQGGRSGPPAGLQRALVRDGNGRRWAPGSCPEDCECPAVALTMHAGPSVHKQRQPHPQGQGCPTQALPLSSSSFPVLWVLRCDLSTASSVGTKEG